MLLELVGFFLAMRHYTGSYLELGMFTFMNFKAHYSMVELVAFFTENVALSHQDHTEEPRLGNYQ